MAAGRVEPIRRHTPQILQSDIFRPAAGVTQISVGE
jgi:hypothetical protein